MVKKIKKQKNKNKTDIDKNIEKGMLTIYNVCGKKAYDTMKLLMQSNSLVMEEAFRFINHAYRLNMMHNAALKNGDYVKLNHNINLFMKKYQEKYLPSMPMGLYSIFFMMNKLLSDYIKINNYKKYFISTKENDLYSVQTYKELNKIFDVKIKPNDFKPIYSIDQMYDFKHILELLSNNMIILDKYRERIYNKNILKNNVLKTVTPVYLEEKYINQFEDNIMEYKLLNDLTALSLAAKKLIGNKITKDRMIIVRPFDLINVEKDFKYLKNSLENIDLFLKRMIILVYDGIEVRSPFKVNEKIKEITKTKKIA